MLLLAIRIFCRGRIGALSRINWSASTTVSRIDQLSFQFCFHSQYFNSAHVSLVADLALCYKIEHGAPLYLNFHELVANFTLMKYEGLGAFWGE